MSFQEGVETSDKTLLMITFILVACLACLSGIGLAGIVDYLLRKLRNPFQALSRSTSIDNAPSRMSTPSFQSKFQQSFLSTAL